MIIMILAPTASAGSVEILTHSLPAPRGFASAVWTGEAAYLFGGFGPTSTPARDIVRFDPSGGATLLAAMLPEAVAETGVAWDGTHVYIFGGKTTSGYSDKITRFTPSTGTVAVLGVTLPSPRGGVAAFWDARDRPEAGCPGGCAYLLGGRIGPFNDISSIVKFNARDNVVTTLPEVLPRRTASHSVAWTGEKAFIVGIYEGNQGYLDPSIFEYAPATGVVKTKAAMLPSGRQSPAAVWNGHSVLIFGGYASGATDAILRYDPVRDQIFTFSPSLSSARYASAAVVSEQAQVYLLGGWTPSGPTSQILKILGGSPPGPPLGVAAQAGPSRGEITISWSAPATTGGEPLTGYRVYRGDSPANLVHLATVTNGLSYSDTNRGDGRLSHYRVSSENALGESAPSPIVNATTYGTPGAPRAPTGQSGPDRGTVTIAWEIPDSDGGKPITGYTLTLESQERGALAPVHLGPSTNFVVQDLLDGEVLHVRIAAVNELGTGSTTPALELRAPFGPLAWISVEPTSMTLTVGQSAQFRARGSDSRGNELAIDIQWHAICGVIEPDGRYTAPVHPRGCYVFARFEEFESFAIVEVVPGRLARVVVSTHDVVVGEVATFAVEGFDAYDNPVGTNEPFIEFHAPTVPGQTIVCYREDEIEACSSVTILPGPLDRMELSLGGATVEVGEVYDLALHAYDRFGNEIIAAAVVEADRGSVVDGQYVAPTLAGADTIRAHEGSMTATLPIDVVPGPLSAIEIFPLPDSVAAGSEVAFEAGGRDAFGNPVVVAILWSASCGTIGHDGRFVAPTMASRTCVIEARDGEILESIDVAVVPGPLARVVLSGPNEAVAGSTIRIDHEGLDVYENLIAEHTGSFDHTVPTVAGADDACGSFGSIVACWSYLVLPGPLDRLTIGIEAPVIEVGLSYVLQLAGFDEYGNPVVTNPVLSAERGAVHGNTYLAPRWAGSDSIEASDGPVAALLEVSVRPGPLDRLSVEGPAELEVGRATRFVADGFDAFGNPLVVESTWTTTIGSIDVDGNFVAPTFLTSGFIEARVDHVVSEPHGLSTFAGPLARIEIASPTLAANVWRSVALVARGFDEYGNGVGMTDLAWSTDFGTINEAGVFRSTQVGNALITVASRGVSGSLLLPVVSDLRIEIEVNGAASTSVGVLRGDATGRVLVRFQDGFGAAGSLVAVQLWSRDALGRERLEPLASGSTNAGGNFEFRFPAEFLAPGEYELKATAFWSQNEGFANREHPMTLI